MRATADAPKPSAKAGALQQPWSRLRRMRHHMGFAVVAAGLALALAHLSAQPSARTAIVGGTLIDGNGGAPIADAVVLVEGARITAAGPRGAVTIPADVQQVDARGRWIIPGM